MLSMFGIVVNSGILQRPTPLQRIVTAGFGLFKAGQRVGCLRDFTVAENVIVQTTAVATATMPLAAGFVGVVPALRWSPCH